MDKVKPKIYRTVYDSNRYPVIVSETGSYVTDGRKPFDTPDAVYDFCSREMRMDFLPDEYVYIFVLDTKNRLTGFFEGSHGSSNCSLVPVREIMRNLLALDAISFIMVHNHPSGDPTPSQEDITATKNLAAASETVGVRFVDHIIVGDGSYYSFMEKR